MVGTLISIKDGPKVSKPGYADSLWKLQGVLCCVLSGPKGSTEASVLKGTGMRLGR